MISATQRADMLAQLIARMKAEILADIENGNVPASVNTFSCLHDHVDANGYGGLCEPGVYEALEQAFGGPRRVGMMEDASPPAMTDFINEAQTAVDRWLRRQRAD